MIKKPIIIKDQPSAVIRVLLLRSSGMLLLFILGFIASFPLAVKSYPSGFFFLLFLLFIISFIGLLSLLFIKILSRLRPREIRIDDDGVGMDLNNKTFWFIPWQEIIRLQTKKWRVYKGYLLGFIIHIKNDTIEVRGPRDFAPIEELQRVFREIVKATAGSNVVVEDKLGWLCVINPRNRK